MYKYIFVESDAELTFTAANHREIIEKYSREGYRFVCAIPSRTNGHGRIKNFDLVFEKEADAR